MTNQSLGPPPELRFRPRISMRDHLRALWEARGLVRTLAERELRARYKQTALGFAWAIATPLAFMVAFTFFVGRFAEVPTAGKPYPLFAYVALLPWMFFASSLGNGGSSLLVNSSLLNKVFCPREVFPIATLAVAAVDSAIGVGVLLVLFVAYGVAPAATTMWVPVLLAVQVAFTLGLTLVFSAAVVHLRDLRHAIALLLQFGLFTTPVAYGMDAVPDRYRLIYSALNPLAPVIDGYRRAVLWGKAPQWGLTAAGAITAAVVLVGGYRAFKRLEGGIADVA